MIYSFHNHILADNLSSTVCQIGSKYIKRDQDGQTVQMQTQILFNISLDNASIWPSSSNAWQGHLHKYLYMLEANHCASNTLHIFKCSCLTLHNFYQSQHPMHLMSVFNLPHDFQSLLNYVFMMQATLSSSYAIQLLRIFLDLGEWNPSCKPHECYRRLDS